MAFARSEQIKDEVNRDPKASDAGLSSKFIGFNSDPLKVPHGILSIPQFGKLFFQPDMSTKWLGRIPKFPAEP